MSHRRLVAVFSVIALVSLSAAPVVGQTRTTADIPRAPDGRPALSGVWDFRTVTPLERPSELADKEFFTEEEAAAFASQRVRESNVDLNRATTARKVVNGTIETRDRAGLQRVLEGSGHKGRRDPANIAGDRSTRWEDSCPHR